MLPVLNFKKFLTFLLQNGKVHQEQRHLSVTLQKGIHGPLPPNRVTASLTEPNGGFVSITALKLNLRIPGAGVESPLPAGPSPNGSESEPLSYLISVIHGVPGTASAAGSGASAIAEELTIVAMENRLVRNGI